MSSTFGIRLSGLIALLALASPLALAQTDSTSLKPMQEITLQDGSEVIGAIVAEDEATMTIITLSNIQMVIPREQIKGMRPATGQVVRGRYYPPDPNATRLLLAPTARAIRAGGGYFAVSELFFPMFAVGIADVVSLAAGMSLFPGASQQIFYFAPKVTPVHYKNLDLAVGLLHIGIPGAEPIGILYTLGTYGKPEAAVTLGLGWGYAQGDLNSATILMIGGELRLSPHIKLITENWFPPGSDVRFFSGGVRFFGQRLAADFSFIRPVVQDWEGFPFIPWIGFAYKFGN